MVGSLLFPSGSKYSGSFVAATAAMLFNFFLFTVLFISSRIFLLSKFICSVFIAKFFFTPTAPAHSNVKQANVEANGPDIDKKIPKFKNDDQIKASCSHLFCVPGVNRNGHKPRFHLIDSGASCHLVSRKQLTQEELRRIRKAAEPMPLQTANGIITADEVVDIYIEGLQESITCYILNDTPNAISLESLCDDLGFDYVKKAGQKPYLRRNGFKYFLDTTQNVPIICPGLADEGSDVSQGDVGKLEDDWEFVGDVPEVAEVADSQEKSGTNKDFAFEDHMEEPSSSGQPEASSSKEGKKPEEEDAALQDIFNQASVDKAQGNLRHLQNQITQRR